METNQVNTALRYAGSSVATMFTIMGALAIIPADSAKELIGQLHVLSDSLATAYGALIKMWVILGPVALVWLGRMGVQSSSVKGLVGKLLSIAQGESPQAQQAQVGLASATSQVVQSTPGAPIAAKAAVLQAAASLPETTGKIVVTDTALAASVASNRVVSQ